MIENFLSEAVFKEKCAILYRLVEFSQPKRSNLSPRQAEAESVAINSQPGWNKAVSGRLFPWLHPGR